LRKNADEEILTWKLNQKRLKSKFSKICANRKLGNLDLLTIPVIFKVRISRQKRAKDRYKETLVKSKNNVYRQNLFNFL
jgi:hypothetical protein